MSILKELKEFANKLNILVVEDDKNLNEEIVNLVSLFFQEVFFAYNGVEALDIYEKNRIDVVITDITMPKMDGVALSKKLKQLYPEQSIVVVSAHRDSAYLVQLIDIGIDQLVYKPFDHQELLYRLLRVCEDITLKQQMYDLFIKEEEKQQQNKVTTDVSFVKELELPTHKIPQAAFVITDELIDDIEYLIELRDELENFVDAMTSGQTTQEHLRAVAFVLSKMYTVFSGIPFLESMSILMYELSNFMENIRYSSLRKDQIKNLGVFEYIYEDISHYIDTVLVKRKADNATHLEKSLRASLTQLKQNIFNDFVIDEEMELF